MPFLKELNDISNAYKHSFINSDLRWVGKEEPVVNAMHYGYGKDNEQPFIYSMKLRTMIESYDTFFKTIIALVKESNPFKYVK